MSIGNGQPDDNKKKKDNEETVEKPIEEAANNDNEGIERTKMMVMMIILFCGFASFKNSTTNRNRSLGNKSVAGNRRTKAKTVHK